MYSQACCPCNLNQLSFITLLCNIFEQMGLPEVASNHHRDGKHLKQ